MNFIYHRYMSSLSECNYPVLFQTAFPSVPLCLCGVGVTLLSGLPADYTQIADYTHLPPIFCSSSTHRQFVHKLVLLLVTFLLVATLLHFVYLFFSVHQEHHSPATQSAPLTCPRQTHFAILLTSTQLALLSSSRQFPSSFPFCRWMLLFTLHPQPLLLFLTINRLTTAVLCPEVRVLSICN